RAPDTGAARVPARRAGPDPADPGLRRHGPRDPPRPGHPGRLIGGRARGQRAGADSLAPAHPARRILSILFPMIRTGYLRWEIDVSDDKCPVDPRAREVVFRARPAYRVVRVRSAGQVDAEERFLQGDATYDVVLKALKKEGDETDVVIPDVGP